MEFFSDTTTKCLYSHFADRKNVHVQGIDNLTNLLKKINAKNDLRADSETKITKGCLYVKWHFRQCELEFWNGNKTKHMTITGPKDEVKMCIEYIKSDDVYLAGDFAEELSHVPKRYK